MYIQHFLCLFSVSRHFNCFHIFTAVNNTSMNTGVQTSLQVHNFNYFVHTYSISAGSCSMLLENFYEHSLCFPEWMHHFSSYQYYTMCQPLSWVQLFVTTWTVVHQDPLSMEFSRQEYQIGLPFPSPGELPDLGIKSRSPDMQEDSLNLSHTGSPAKSIQMFQFFNMLTNTCFFMTIITLTSVIYLL